MWALVLFYWQASTGEGPVNTRLLIAAILGIAVGTGILVRYSWRRSRELRQLKGEEIRLKPEEIQMLRFLAAHDTEQIPVGRVAEQMKLSPIKFQYHWHRICNEFYLVDLLGISMGHHLFMLSHTGRKYVIEKGLIK